MKFAFKTVFISFLTICFTQSCHSQRQNNIDAYNFDFEHDLNILNIESSWQISGCLLNKLVLDKLEFKEGSASAKISVFSCDISKGRPFRIYQLIKIPINTKSIDVAFWFKTEKITGGKFKIIALNSDERIIDSSIINLPLSQEWRNIKGEISNGFARMLYIEFEIKDNSTVWLDNIEIQINNLNLFNHTDTENEKLILFPETILKGLHPKIFDLQDPVISDLDKMEVIGLGETIHGGHEMLEYRNSLIKQIVENENCRLVVLEAPEIFAEHYNKYVQGSLSDKELRDPEWASRSQFFNRSEEIIELLSWIRDFNKTVNRKVQIAGMDVSQEWYTILRELISPHSKSYDIKKLNTYLKISETDSILMILSNHKDRIIKDVGTSKYDSLCSISMKYHHFVTISRSLFENKIRDSIMSVNLISLIKKNVRKGEKVVVCAHLSHLNKEKVNNSIDKSLGYYINKNFNSKYFVIGFIAANGKYKVDQIPNTYDLASPIAGSIEYYSEKLLNKPFYLNIKSEPMFNSKIIYTRFIGGIPKNYQFSPGNLSKRIDAIIFIPEITPIHLYNYVSSPLNNR